MDEPPDVLKSGGFGFCVCSHLVAEIGEALEPQQLRGGASPRQCLRSRHTGSTVQTMTCGLFVGLLDATTSRRA